MPTPRKPTTGKVLVRPRGGVRPGPYTPKHTERWVLYGYATKDGTRHAIHEERLQSEAEGMAWLTIHALRGWKTHAVLVRLDNGHDVNGQRHVVYRTGDGRAWWE